MFTKKENKKKQIKNLNENRGSLADTLNFYFERKAKKNEINIKKNEPTHSNENRSLEKYLADAKECELKKLN